MIKLATQAKEALPTMASKAEDSIPKTSLASLRGLIREEVEEDKLEDSRRIWIF